MVHPPFGRVYGNILGNCMSPSSRQTSRINSFPRSIFIKLDLGISPPLPNRFSRFQRRCNLLIHTFPTVYNMTQYSEGFSEEEQVNKNTAIAGSHPPEQV